MSEEIKVGIVPVENTNGLVLIGEPESYTVNCGEMLVMDKKLPPQSVFVLADIHGIPEGTVVTLGNHRRFIPTFETAKSQNEYLVAWDSPEQDDEGKPLVRIRGHIIKDLGTINMTGWGYEKVDVHVYECSAPTDLLTATETLNPKPDMSDEMHKIFMDSLETLDVVEAYYIDGDIKVNTIDNIDPRRDYVVIRKPSA